MARRARIIITVLVVLAVLILCVALFGYQAMVMIETRRIASRFPVTDKTPVPLSDFSVSQAAGKTFSLLGYTFALPWSDLDESKSKAYRTRLLIALDSGNAVIASSVPPQDFIHGIESDLKTTRERLRLGFGDQAVKSDYDFQRLILYTTRKQVTLTMPWRASTSVSMLLMLKGVMVPTADSDLYSIQTKDLKGFQLGDPKRRPFKMAIELYDDDGELEIVFSQKTSGQVPSISQADLNCVIQSIRRTPATQTSLAK